MDATPIDFGDALPLSGGDSAMGIRSPRHYPPTALIQKWSAIHEAAGTIGAIAGIDQRRVIAELERGLGRFIPDGDDSVVEQDVQDLAEILQQGIAALLTAHTSGGAPHAAAQALWKEFVGARDAVLAYDPSNAAVPPA